MFSWSTQRPTSCHSPRFRRALSLPLQRHVILSSQHHHRCAFAPSGCSSTSTSTPHRCHSRSRRHDPDVVRTHLTNDFLGRPASVPFKTLFIFRIERYPIAPDKDVHVSWRYVHGYMHIFALRVCGEREITCVIVIWGCINCGGRTLHGVYQSMVICPILIEVERKRASRYFSPSTIDVEYLETGCLWTKCVFAPKNTSKVVRSLKFTRNGVC